MMQNKICMLRFYKFVYADATCPINRYNHCMKSLLELIPPIKAMRLLELCLPITVGELLTIFKEPGRQNGDYLCYPMFSTCVIISGDYLIITGAPSQHRLAFGRCPSVTRHGARVSRQKGTL